MIANEVGDERANLRVDIGFRFSIVLGEYTGFAAETSNGNGRRFPE